MDQLAIFLAIVTCLSSNFLVSAQRHRVSCDKGDLAVEINPVRESVDKVLYQNTSVLYINSSKVFLNLTCSGHVPVHWDFKFDRVGVKLQKSWMILFSKVLLMKQTVLFVAEL